MRRALAALACLGLFTAPGRAAAPPARPTAAQRAELAEVPRLADRAWACLDAGRVAEAVEALAGALRVDRRVLGQVPAWRMGRLDVLAKLQERRGRFAEALRWREEALALERAYHGEGHWRVTEARLDRQDTRLLGLLAPDGRRKLQQAAALNEQVTKLWGRGRAGEALPLARRALALRLEVLGEKHRDTVLSLFNLAAQHQQLLRYAEAGALYERAVRLAREVVGRRHPLYAACLGGCPGSAATRGTTPRRFACWRRRWRCEGPPWGKAPPSSPGA